MATFKLELVSPAKLLFSGEVDEVIVPGAEGEFTVLPMHAPVVSTLRPGILIVKAGGNVTRLYVRGGFAEVNEKGLTILAEDATAVEDVNMTEFAASVSAYEAKLASASSDEARFKMAETLFQLKAVQAQLGGGTHAAH
ncbi:MAG: F0F1 ATP synthase subunit epsilon [Rhizobiales bacterium]|jgi:F-type H+-transporting ATPase subunit epsilon|nr:F0F1 ATP synthase subunit epsilon [Hyphomicrobiales bacterium]